MIGKIWENNIGGNMRFSRYDENYVYVFVGKNIRKFRKQKSWTQKQLAEKSTYSKQFISNIENNVHQTFSLGTLWKLAEVLEVDMFELCKEPEMEMEKIKY